MEERPTFSDLAAQSVKLFASGAAQSAAILAAAMAPVALLAVIAFWATGLVSQERLNDAIQTGEWLRAAPLFAVGVTRKLVATLAYLALVFSVDARRAGTPISLRDAYAFAAEKFIPFVLTALRALAWILGGLFLLIIPGLILAVRYSLTHMAVILESERGKAALQRSQDLITAEPGRAVGFLAAATAGALALDFFVALIMTVGAGFVQAVAGDAVSVFEGQFQALISEVLGGMVGAWLIGFSILLYRDLASRHPAQ